VGIEINDAYPSIGGLSKPGVMTVCHLMSAAEQQWKASLVDDHFYGLRQRLLSPFKVVLRAADVAGIQEDGRIYVVKRDVTQGLAQKGRCVGGSRSAHIPLYAFIDRKAQQDIATLD
jgi:hypothetical protein